MRRILPVLLLAVVAGACAPRATVPDSERQRARAMEGERRYTKVALDVGPFFGDASKLLVSDSPFSELDLLVDTEGKTISPPRPERVLLPGVPVRIEKVEFPTGWLISQRVIMTPRYHPWVYLSAPGERRPLIVVLPQTLTSADDVRVELERILGATDPAPALAALPPEQRAAIGRKQLVDGMEPSAVEMAWGYPEKKVIDRPSGSEAWSWADGRRTASFQNGRLVKWEERRG